MVRWASTTPFVWGLPLQMKICLAPNRHRGLELLRAELLSVV